MTSVSNADRYFTKPGVVRVLPAALYYAKTFGEAVARRAPGPWIVGFDWAQVTLRPGPTIPVEALGHVVTLGAYRKADIPPAFTSFEDGFEYVVRVPEHAFRPHLKKLIDFDPSQPLKLVLR